MPPVLCDLNVGSKNQVICWSSGQMSQDAGFNIDGFAHGNQENLTNIYPTAFNLGSEGAELTKGNSTYKISDP